MGFKLTAVYRTAECIILSFAFLHLVHANQRIDEFKGLSGCMRGWISPKYPFYSCSTKSVIECIAVCARTHGCYSVNACNNGAGSVTCVIIRNVVDGCDDLAASDTCRYLQHKDVTSMMANNPCLNGGTWEVSVCHCVWGFAGDLCERLVRSCREAFELGVRGESFYDIQPLNSSVIYSVFCNCGDGAGGTMQVLKRRVSAPWCSPISYNRTWEEYKKGFGDIECDYFMGLETVYQLTKYAKYQWSIINSMKYGGSSSIQIEDTVIKSETENYAVDFIRIFQASWEYGDEAFDETEKPREFCTWDRDCNGCAETVGGGWWFTSDCKGGVLTAPQLQMVWPFNGTDKAINVAFLQMELRDYR